MFLATTNGSRGGIRIADRIGRLFQACGWQWRKAANNT